MGLMETEGGSYVTDLIAGLMASFPAYWFSFMTADGAGGFFLFAVLLVIAFSIYVNLPFVSRVGKRVIWSAMFFLIGVLFGLFGVGFDSSFPQNGVNSYF